MGFEESITGWKRFIKPGRFLVVHDEDRDRTRKIEAIAPAGYGLIGHFGISEEVFWKDYYLPLERLIHEFEEKYPDDDCLRKEFEKDLIEIERCRSKETVFSSFFVAMQRDW
jgi:hypothetical protein